MLRNSRDTRLGTEHSVQPGWGDLERSKYPNYFGVAGRTNLLALISGRDLTPVPPFPASMGTRKPFTRRVFPCRRRPLFYAPTRDLCSHKAQKSVIMRSLQ